ncbi:MAG: hypothetical protein H0X42_07945 [Solirubrobacterales bacterium]|nr:hypothetical protein [Solirubrobacterales bacterium]
MKRRWWGRRAAAVSGLAGVLTLLAHPLGRAGTDVFQNIGPASPLAGASFGRFPLSSYTLDQHFTVISASLTGGVDVSGLLPEIAWFFAAMTWLVTSFLAKVVVELFSFAFNLDLVNGSQATGGAGALGPVSAAIHSIYANVFGAPWLVLAISLVGLWAMWKALVQRRYSETAGALALSLIYVVIALFFVAEPGQTIGQASRWTNEMSQAFLSITSHGDPSGGEQASADDADQLFGLLIEKPWAVLEFGGLEHCAVSGTGDEDSDPESAPVRPLSSEPSRDAELAHRLASGTEVSADGKVCVNNANKYSQHFLRFSGGSDERKEEYEALDQGDSGKLPDADPEKAGYKLGVADKPATDAMEEGGQYQRLVIALLVAIGELGAFILLGALSIGVILAQVMLLLLLAFSPVALVAAAIPGRGHDFFKVWLGKLAGYLLRKAAYSLVLAVLLAINGALLDATASLGWLFSFGLQSVFFWMVLIQRRTLTDGIIGIATGPRTPGHDRALDALALYGGARLALRGPLRGAGMMGGAAVSRLRGSRGSEDRHKAPLGGVSHTVASGGAGDQKATDATAQSGDGQSAGAQTADAQTRSSDQTSGRGTAETPKTSGEQSAKGAKRSAPADEQDSQGEAKGSPAATETESDKEGGGQDSGRERPSRSGAPGSGSPVNTDGDRRRGEDSPRAAADRSREAGTRRGSAPNADKPSEEGDAAERGAARRARPNVAETAARSNGAEAGPTPEASTPVRRPRPEVRQPAERHDSGSSSKPPADSDLSEELAAEREGAKRSAEQPSVGPPSTPKSAGENAATDQPTPSAEEPASPPRRTRRPLRRRK